MGIRDLCYPAHVASNVAVATRKSSAFPAEYENQLSRSKRVARPVTWLPSIVNSSIWLVPGSSELKLISSGSVDQGFEFGFSPHQHRVHPDETVLEGAGRWRGGGLGRVRHMPC